jgi:hypothetical protein
MKIDFSRLLFYIVLVGLLVSLFFNFRGYERDSLFQEMEQKNLSLEKVRDSLKVENERLEIEFDERQKAIEKRSDSIVALQALLDIAKKDAAKYKGRADKFSKDLVETNKKIEYLRKNTIKRDDDDLIDSLKNKLKTT